jgi:UDP:flavonoid glycosyltransferase YjiC (YdhE family)
MRIVLITTGARGDTEPFVALAVRLMRDGHSVRLAARPDFAGLAAGYGVDFAPLGARISRSSPERLTPRRSARVICCASSGTG